MIVQLTVYLARHTVGRVVATVKYGVDVLNNRPRREANQVRVLLHFLREVTGIVAPGVVAENQLNEGSKRGHVGKNGARVTVTFHGWLLPAMFWYAPWNGQ